MAVYSIPIQADSPAQTFSIVLDSTSYNFTALWNSRAEFWTLDIADENGDTVISDIALKGGSNLLAPFNLGMGILYLYDVSESGQEATLSNIGVDVILLYAEPE